MKKLIVEKRYNNKKLSKFIQDSFPNLSINIFFKALRQKDIKINNTRINKDCTIKTGDEILVYISDELLMPSILLEIVYEDENILIINKPVGIEVTGENSLTTLVHSKYTNSNYKPMPCHRLDRNTIGLVLFAKNQASLDILLSKFKSHEIKKYYLAWVYGIPKNKKCNLKHYLFKDSKKSMVFISDVPKKGYQTILTSYTVLREFKNNTSLLDIEIETGKTHQIRAHLAYIRFPIIGDGKYGINSINKSFNSKYQHLYSYKLMFNFTSNSGILDYLNHKCFELDISKYLKNFENYETL